jgi:2-keto-4-pentenoate hydratase/2-oxohepta-3-ene-1,7-dioic acid hydratase in catechol pathway
MQHIAIGEGLRRASGRTVATVLLALLGGLSLTAQGASYLRFQDDGGAGPLCRALGRRSGAAAGRRAVAWGAGPGQPPRLSEAQLLAPVTPRSVIAIGYNYPSHTADRPDPTALGMFAKLPGAITGPGR